MNLAYELSRHGITWGICSGTIEAEEGRAARRCINVLMTLEDGRTVTHQLGFSHAQSTDSLLALALRAQAKDHPVLQAWYQSHGNDEVSLVRGALSNLSELLHVALRKCTDTKQSTICWNAIHHLHPDDWASMLDSVGQGLRKLKKLPKKLTRRKVGQSIKAALEERVAALHDDSTLSHGYQTHRNDLQKFALRMMLVGCGLTEGSDWTWGWAAYLCTDKPAQAEQPEAAVAAC